MYTLTWDLKFIPFWNRTSPYLQASSYPLLLSNPSPPTHTHTHWLSVCPWPLPAPDPDLCCPRSQLWPLGVCFPAQAGPLGQPFHKYSWCHIHLWGILIQGMSSWLNCFAENQAVKTNSLKLPLLKMPCHFLHATMQMNLEKIRSERSQIQRLQIVWFYLDETCKIGKFIKIEKLVVAQLLGEREQRGTGMGLGSLWRVMEMFWN